MITPMPEADSSAFKQCKTTHLHPEGPDEKHSSLSLDGGGEAMTNDVVAKSTLLTRRQFMREYEFSDSAERRGRTGGE